MEAEFAVELGADDETLEFPWQDPEGSCHYFDLKSSPELIASLPEVRDAPELAEFLTAVNAAGGLLESAKCDVWTTAEMSVEEEIFDAQLKFGSYVDLLFRYELRFSFDEHERWARQMVADLKRAPEAHASAQLLIRRCYFQEGTGFYFTLYVFGYGDDVGVARERWALALKQVQTSIQH